MMQWVYAGVAAAVLIAAMLIFRARRKRRRDDSMIAVVQLRTRPRNLTEADVRGAIRRVLKVEATVIEAPPPGGMPGRVFAARGDDLPPLLVIDCAGPYMSEEGRAATIAKFEHPSVREGIERHKAWLSVDALGISSAGVSGEKRQKVYSVLTALALELSDDDCLLVYLPAEPAMGPPGREGLRWLAEGARSGEFDSGELGARVFGIEKTNARVNAAMAEAKRRLPEFCSAYESAGPGFKGMIKVGFVTSDGGKEYIWLDVKDMTDSGFSGTIENHPVDSSIPKKGTRVDVKLEDIVDWVYLDGEQSEGLFVDRVLLAQKAN